MIGGRGVWSELVLPQDTNPSNSKDSDRSVVDRNLFIPAPCLSLGRQIQLEVLVVKAIFDLTVAKDCLAFEGETQILALAEGA